eukprot:5160380-Amphidinium_carterae.1
MKEDVRQASHIRSRRAAQESRLDLLVQVPEPHDPLADLNPHNPPHPASQLGKKVIRSALQEAYQQKKRQHLISSQLFSE